MDLQDIPASSGIYRITCTTNGRIYIGSAKNLQARWQRHRKDLRGNIHHSISLQRAWNKYSEQAFAFEVIELVLLPFLLEREQYWLDKLEPFNDRGFNIARVAGSSLGIKRSPETREKLRRKALNMSNETRAKIGASQIGRKFSPEHRAKLRDASTGQKHNREYQLKPLILTSPEGVDYLVKYLQPFCKEYGLTKTNISRVANGKQSHHKGWHARFAAN